MNNSNGDQSFLLEKKVKFTEFGKLPAHSKLRFEYTLSWAVSFIAPIMTAVFGIVKEPNASVGNYYFAIIAYNVIIAIMFTVIASTDDAQSSDPEFVHPEVGFCFMQAIAILGQIVISGIAMTGSLQIAAIWVFSGGIVGLVALIFF